MKSVYLLAAFLFSFFVSCTASDDIEDIIENNPKKEASFKKSSDIPTKEKYKILVMGNSLSRDAFSYVPAIMKNCCENVSFAVNILYRGNKSLADHRNSIGNDIVDYTFDYYNTNTERWELRSLEEVCSCCR